MESGILGGLIAHATLSLIVENEITDRYFHARSDTISIRFRPNQENLELVIGIAAIIPEELWPLAVVVDENV